MTETNQAPTMPDPRPLMASTIDAITPMMSFDQDQADSPTPCADFTVSELADHLIGVVRRIAVVGNGDHFTTAIFNHTETDRAEVFAKAGAEAKAAWSNDATFNDAREVPWGTLPGPLVVAGYIAELAVHGWDLSVSTGQKFAVDQQAYEPTLIGYRMGLPEDRTDPGVPFEPPTDPGPDATVIEQLAAWAGRDVSAWPRSPR